MLLYKIVKPMAAGVLAGLLWLVAGAVAAQETLGSYPVDPAKVSISGISSGAFMANQFHLAHSNLIMGAGIIAGGLYGCAIRAVDDNGQPSSLASIATSACMTTPGMLRPAATYAARAQGFAERGTIDPLSGLRGDRVYMFTGHSDHVVNPEIVRRGRDVYRLLGIAQSDLQFVGVNALPGNGAGHSWVTRDYGVPCDANRSPYINDCDYDQAGAILIHIYGKLNPPASQLTGSFVEFSQAEFVPGGRLVPETGLWHTGYVYVPKSCAPGSATQCALHVALHGCRQSAQELQDTFYKHVGLNEWADTNNIIVLYPQARRFGAKDMSTQQPGGWLNFNPEGCWNWFGYGGDSNYMLKSGVQISAIYNMIRRIMGVTD